MHNSNIFFDINKLKYLGENVIIGKSVRIRNPEKVSIDDNSIIDDFTYISANLEVGKYCHIASNVTISGGGGHVRIGDFVGIGTSSALISQSSDYISASFELPSIPESMRFGGYGKFINIKDHVLLGAHTVVLPDVTLPKGLASTAKTILRKKEYEEWCLYDGIDAKKLLKRSNKKLLNHLEKYNF